VIRHNHETINPSEEGTHFFSWLAGYLNIGWDFTLHVYVWERAPTK